MKIPVTFVIALASSLIPGFAFAAPVAGAPAPAVVNTPSPAAATNIPAYPPPAVRSAPDELPAPIAPDTPRTGPPAAGQTISDDYKIGAQDLLEIQIYGIDGLKREVRVNSRGVITLPLIGPVVLGGLTSQEAEALITAKYAKDYLQDPQVSLFIKEFTSQRITIEGAVNKPGIYPIRGQTTLLQAIAIAGGQGQLSDMNEVMLFRVENGEKKTIKYDVVRIRGGELEDPMLANEDVVVVKRSPSRVVMKDSLFRDVLDAINPFNYLRPF